MTEAGKKYALSWACIPLLCPILAGILALFFADRWPSGPWWLVAVACGVFFLRGRRLGWLFAAFVSLWLGHQHSYQIRSQEVWRSHESLDISASGVVIGQPVYRWNSSRFLCKIDHADGLPAGVSVELKWTGREVKHGEKIRFRAEFEPTQSPRNPGQFDRQPFLWRQGVALSSTRTIFLRREGSVWWRLPIRWTQEMSQKVEARLTDGLDKDSVEALVIKAVTLGHRPDRSDPVLQDFRDSGTLHIFAVSGLHVGLVILVVGMFLRFVGMSLSLTSSVLICVAIGYAALTGFPPAAVRAALMASLILLGVIMRQRAVFFNGMALSALLVLMWDSHQLFQPGFQLSYGVLTVIVLTTGIVLHWFKPIVEVDEFMPATLLSTWQRRALVSRRYTAGLVASSATAWIGSMPLSGLYFRMFTPVSILASVLLAPQILFLMGFALLSLAVGMLSSDAQRLVNKGTAVFAKTSAWTAATMADLPGGSWDLQRLLSEDGQVVVFDLAAGGNAVAVNIEDGLLVDCGSHRAYRSTLLDGMRYLSMRPADLVITHPAADACGGMESLLATGNTRRIWVPTTNARSPAFRAGMALAEEKSIDTRRPTRGEWIPLSTDARWRVLNSPWELDGSLIADDWSMVIQLEIRGWRLLLMGDAGREAQRQILESATDLKSDVVIYGESQRSGADMHEFWDRVAPQIVIMSHSDRVAEFSANQHLVTQLEKRGAEVMLQNRTGAITLKCQESLLIESFLTKQRALLTRD